MPNWCHNELKVSGKPEDLRRFKKAVQVNRKEYKSDLSLDKTFPIPKELETTDSPPDKPDYNLVNKYGYDNWYDWRIANWGTKWEVSAKLERETEKELVYYFDSAWSPPILWLGKISKDYPTLTFKIKYKEEGMGFSGGEVMKNGKETAGKHKG